MTCTSWHFTILSYYKKDKITSKGLMHQAKSVPSALAGPHLWLSKPVHEKKIIIKWWKQANNIKRHIPICEYFSWWHGSLEWKKVKTNWSTWFILKTVSMHCFVYSLCSWSFGFSFLNGQHGLLQGFSTLALKVHIPAEFSSNLNQTNLNIIQSVMQDY